MARRHAPGAAELHAAAARGAPLVVGQALPLAAAPHGRGAGEPRGALRSHRHGAGRPGHRAHRAGAVQLLPRARARAARRCVRARAACRSAPLGRGGAAASSPVPPWTLPALRPPQCTWPRSCSRPPQLASFVPSLPSWSPSFWSSATAISPPAGAAAATAAGAAGSGGSAPRVGVRAWAWGLPRLMLLCARAAHPSCSWHMFDGLIVLISLTLELSLRGVAQEVASLLIFFRWVEHRV